MDQLIARETNIVCDNISNAYEINDDETKHELLGAIKSIITGFTEDPIFKQITTPKPDSSRPLITLDDLRRFVHSDEFGTQFEKVKNQPSSVDSGPKRLVLTKKGTSFADTPTMGSVTTIPRKLSPGTTDTEPQRKPNSYNDFTRWCKVNYNTNPEYAKESNLGSKDFGNIWRTIGEGNDKGNMDNWMSYVLDYVSK